MRQSNSLEHLKQIKKMEIKTNIGENLYRYHYRKRKYVVWDLETECLNLYYNRPWEIGYIVVDGARIQERQNRRIWWDDLKISDGAARICNFNPDDYKRTAENKEEVLEEFESFLYNPEYINIFYNGLNFDCYILQNWRRELGKPNDYSFLKRSIDVLSLGRGWAANFALPETRSDFYEWQYKCLNFLSDPVTRRARAREIGGTSLQTLCNKLGVTVDSDGSWHQGLYDVVATFRLFEKLLWAMEITKEHMGLTDNS